MFVHLMHETIWSSVPGVVDGLSPKERADALDSLKGTWRDPKDNETWKSASTCAGADGFLERVNCWSK